MLPLPGVKNVKPEQSYVQVYLNATAAAEELNTSRDNYP